MRADSACQLDAAQGARHHDGRSARRRTRPCARQRRECRSAVDCVPWTAELLEQGNQRGDDVVVVLDQQTRPASSAPTRASRPAAPRRRRQRQEQRDDGAAARCAVRSRRCARLRREAIDLRRARARVPAGRLGREEGLEQAAQDLGRNALAVSSTLTRRAAARRRRGPPSSAWTAR